MFNYLILKFKRYFFKIKKKVYKELIRIYLKKEKNKMLVDKFIKFLENQENRNIILELNGIIKTTIEIKQIEIKEYDKYLNLQSKESKESKEQKIKINLHQLMKINKLNEDKFLLKFDQLQEIKIKLFSN